MNTDNTKVSDNRKKKEAIVADITDKVGRSKAMVFTNYAGLTHQQLETFKKEIRTSDAEFAVAKNTLLKRALGDQIAGEEDKFQQSTGTLFMYGDVVTPLKALAKMMKDFEKPEVKFGLLDGKVITDKDVAKLATLPPREVLIAQMLGMMNAPIQGLHRALSWNLQKFVMTLSAVAKKKETMPIATDKPAVDIASQPTTGTPATQPEPATPATEEQTPTETAEPTETEVQAETTEPATQEETPTEPAQETQPTKEVSRETQDEITEPVEEPKA